MRLYFSGLLLSYLLGTFPTAWLFARLLKGIDIREHGSGNVGATNALRVLGKLPGIFVLAVDFLKGFTAVTFFRNIFIADFPQHAEILTAGFGAAALCGHVFNVFLRFRGGKGVAAGAGVLSVLAPLPLSAGLLAFVIVVMITKYVSLGSIIACVIVPVFAVFSGIHHSYIVLAIFFCVVIILKHRSNIRRLLAGREKKLFEK